jgi:hypothetical protein
VDDGHAGQAPPPRERGVQAGEVVLHRAVLAPPGRVVADRGRVVALGLAAHGDPGEVVDADGHAEGRLPVALGLVAHKVVVPVGHAVELAEHAGAPVLAGDALGLLGGAVLAAVAEHIDAGELEAGQRAHGLADRRRLRLERRLLHHVAGEGDAVGGAPVGQRAGEGLGEAPGHMVVEAVAGQRGPPLRQLPEQLRQQILEALAVGGGVALEQVAGPGEHEVAGLAGAAEAALTGELGLVGEDRGHRAAELVAQQLGVGLVGRCDEALGRRAAERVDVALVVVAGALGLRLQVGVPDGGARRRPLALREAAVGGEAPLAQRHVVAGEQEAILGAGRGVRPDHGPLCGAGRHLAVGPGGEEQVLRAVAQLGGHQAAAEARRPAVLVVEPGEHPLAPPIVRAGPHQAQPLRAHVRRRQAGARVDVEAAHAHRLEHIDLLEQPSLLQGAVPRPEGRPAVLGRRRAEQLGVKRGVVVPGVEVHGLFSVSAATGRPYIFCEGCSGMPAAPMPDPRAPSPCIISGS